MDRVTITDLRESAEALLRELAGPTARLREDQWTAIEALVVQRRRALVVQRTGWGKSAVYFVSAKLLRAAGRGPTVIVSPLLALMRNQVAAAQRAGVVAATINSGNVTEWDEIHTRVAAGAVDVLLVSPERLNNPDFRDAVLPRLAADAGLVVIDEAHCVSDWGHDFRPDYRRIRTLIADLGSEVPVLATTATANDRVVTDVATQIGTDTLVLRGSLDRESLHMSVVRIEDAVARTAWLSRRLHDLPGSGIIYALTVAAAHDLADVLGSHGHRVAAYTGQTDPTERELLEQALLGNEVKALVATSALGMGFDKPDLGFVVHVGAPSSPIAYYQQVGRAGRGTDNAQVVLLPGPEDKRIWSYFASVAFPREHVVREVLAALDPDRPLSTTALEPLVELNRSRLEMVLKVLDVDGAVRRVRGGWLSTGAPWVYDTERYERLAVAREAEQQAMIEYQATTECRMTFLRTQLDDPSLDGRSCGRCDNCTGTRTDTTVDATDLAAIRTRLDRPGIDLAPRKQWPTGMAKLGVPLSGKISDGAEPGRVLGRLSDLGWGQRLRTLLDGPDGPVPDAVFDACVAVLREWNWARRPTSVLAMDSPTHPKLTADLAARLARVGRLRDLGTLPTRPDRRPVTAANSAHRVAALFDIWTPPDLTGLDGPVLLVDAQTDTGWTFTLAAHTLRLAGAPAVLPFALAIPS
ncbi:RecQ family ATP-dependent DNA helicase [Nocardia sp. alder85J]|uniref:RecQ family ATP-dependent DNA helicase n=1 Tax=Nocardia sp. alder85J TaxID=2862949 RepID=UPI001CD4CE7E|nr:RecQ family ATP-dependent DNA helicase [Nocardia sp. alder85J]MCX4097456.1 RecQ family ATP-dependent DNA helicase [Nocardia sp. alder85J]